MNFKDSKGIYNNNAFVKNPIAKGILFEGRSRVFFSSGLYDGILGRGIEEYVL